MKIRFLKTVSTDVETPRLNEIWYKTFNKWTEIRVEEIFSNGKTATIKTSEGEYILMVPMDSFEKLPEKKSQLSL